MPFVYEELVARIRAVVRRSARPTHRTIAVNGLTIDLASRTVRVEGERVCLSAKEYELLIALAEEPDGCPQGGSAPGRLGLSIARIGSIKEALHAPLGTVDATVV